MTMRLTVANRAKLAMVLGLLVCWCGAAGQAVQVMTQNAPVVLEAFSVNTNSASVDVTLTVANTEEEKRVVAVAVGVVLVDAFNDVIAVNYARWTDDLSVLEAGGRTALTNSFVELRADDLFLAVPFIYAVRFEDGEVWKQDLSGVSTELLSRFEVAASSSALQP